jgi:hypothetical protein
LGELGTVGAPVPAGAVLVVVPSGPFPGLGAGVSERPPAPFADACVVGDPVAGSITGPASDADPDDPNADPDPDDDNIVVAPGSALPAGAPGPGATGVDAAVFCGLRRCGGRFGLMPKSPTLRLVGP